MQRLKKKKFQRIWHYIPVLLWAILIYVFSNQETLPSFQLSLLDFLFKKSAHIFVYAVLYFLLFRAFYLEREKTIDKKSFLLPLFLCLLYSITDEIHQSFIPGRHPSPRDLVFDMLGSTSISLYQQRFL